MSTTLSTSSTASRRFSPMVTLVLVCLAIFVGGLDLTVVSAVLPKILADLRIPIDTELNRASWMVSGYLLAYSVSMTFMGRLSDILGRRLVYILCLAIFTIGSWVVAAAPTLEIIIAGRIVQAFGAGAMVPISMALVGDLFPATRRAFALGLIGAVDTAGWVVGHLYGGILMQAFDTWRLLFWINIPFGLAALALTALALRDVHTPRLQLPFDVAGAVLCSLGLVLLQVGLAAGGELGQADFYGRRAGPPPFALPLVIAGLAVLVAFVLVERRAKAPLLDLSLFQRRHTAAACIVNGLLGFALAFAITNVPLFINTRILIYSIGDPDALRRAAWDTGWMLSVLTVTMAVVAVLGGWTVGRFGYRLPTLAGVGATVAGFLLMGRWDAEVSYGVMAIGLAIAGIGFGLIISPVATAVVNAAGETGRGAASALVILLRLVGMTVGVAALTVYGVQRQDTLQRAGASDPLAASDPQAFLMNVAARIIDESSLIAAAVCLLAFVVALGLSNRREQVSAGL